jgi:hypothetical protein
MMRRVSAYLAAAMLFVISGVGSPARAEDPIHFYADLSADEQSDAVYSQGKGRADFTVERATLKLSWKITYSGTAPVVAATINGPQRVGVNAQVVYDLGKKTPKSPLVGSVIMSEGELQYLMERHLYVNITTTKYPDGELRGQIERVPPPGFKKK